jgi:hypothetical protein
MARVYPNSMITALSGRDGCLVYYMIRRNIYARRYVVPRNPDTPAQRKRRTLFAEAVRAWQSLPDQHKQLWNARALRLVMSGYNLFISSFCMAEASVQGSYTSRSHSVLYCYTIATSKLEDSYGGFSAQDAVPACPPGNSWAANSS